MLSTLLLQNKTRGRSHVLTWGDENFVHRIQSQHIPDILRQTHPKKMFLLHGILYKWHTLLYIRTCNLWADAERFYFYSFGNLSLKHFEMFLNLCGSNILSSTETNWVVLHCSCSASCMQWPSFTSFFSVLLFILLTKTNEQNIDVLNSLSGLFLVLKSFG